MNRTLPLAFLAGVSFAWTAPATAHESFDGHAITIEYGLSSNGTASGWIAAKSQTVIGSNAAIEIPALTVTDGVTWEIDFFGDNQISLRYTGTKDFMNFGFPALQGFRIVDAANTLPAIQMVHVLNTAYVPNTPGNLIEGFAAADAFTNGPNDIFINLYQSMYHHHPMPSMGDPYRDRIVLGAHFEHMAQPVPEPEQWLLMLAGLGLAAAVARNRRRG